MVPRHALRSETVLERCSNARPIQRLCLQNRLDGLVDAVNDEARHAIVDHFGRRSRPECAWVRTPLGFRESSLAATSIFRL
jgi:hypothetical protein